MGTVILVDEELLATTIQFHAQSFCCEWAWLEKITLTLSFSQ